MAGHLPLCKRSHRIVDTNSSEIQLMGQDNGYEEDEMYFPEKIEKQPSAEYLVLQQTSLDFTESPSMGHVRMSDVSFKTENWLHYLEIAKFD